MDEMETGFFIASVYFKLNFFLSFVDFDFSCVGVFCLRVSVPRTHCSDMAAKPQGLDL